MDHINNWRDRQVRKLIAWKRVYLTGNEKKKELYRVMEIFNTSVDVWVSQVYAFVKTNQTAPLMWVHFYGCKLYFNFNTFFKKNFKIFSHIHMNHLIYFLGSPRSNLDITRTVMRRVRVVGGTLELRPQRLGTHFYIIIYWPDASQIIHLVLTPLV